MILDRLADFFKRLFGRPRKRRRRAVILLR
jgi:hypothetical protein